MKLYALQQDVTTATKKARAMWFDTDVFDPLIFTEETEREISVKDICSSLKESFVNDKIIEMTENEFIRTRSIQPKLRPVRPGKVLMCPFSS